MLHPSACDAAVAVRLAREHNKGEELEDWLYTHQQDMTPETVRQAARDVGQVTDFDAKYAATLELVKGDIALGQQLKVYADADLLHQRRQGRRRLGAAVLRPGDRVRARSTRSSATSSMPALATSELTKDYRGRLLAQAAVPRARPPDARRRARRGLRISRSQRRRQDHHAQAADAAGVSDLRPRRDPRPPARRLSTSSGASATCRNIRTSTTT